MKVDERLQALQQMHVEFSIHNFNVKHEFFTKLRNTRWRLNLCPVMLYQQSKNFEIGQVSVLYLTIISLSCASYQRISCFWKFHYNPPTPLPRCGVDLVYGECYIMYLVYREFYISFTVTLHNLLQLIISNSLLEVIVGGLFVGGFFYQ